MASVTLLIDRFKQGSSSAFGDLFGRFLRYPMRLVRRPGRTTAHQDGEDIAQCVFWELYRAVREQRPLVEGLSDTTSLLVTLGTLTRQQLRRRWRDNTRQCRDVRRTVSASDLPPGGGDPLEGLLHPRVVRWLRDVDSRETIEQLLALLPQPRHRTVVLLLLHGDSVPEVARALGRSVRAVQRYLVEIQGIWENHPDGRAFLAGR
jgi:DNA-directed RNA polymerase specialized sigma24 family protein